MTISNETKLAVNTAILAGVQEESLGRMNEEKTIYMNLMVKTKKVIELTERATDEILTDQVLNAMSETIYKMMDAYIAIYPKVAIHSIFEPDGFTAKIAAAMEKMTHEVESISKQVLEKIEKEKEA